MVANRFVTQKSCFVKNSEEIKSENVDISSVIVVKNLQHLKTKGLNLICSTEL